MEVGFKVNGLTDKELDDLILAVIFYLRDEMNVMVEDYWTKDNG